MIYLLPIGALSFLLFVPCCRKATDLWASFAWVIGAMVTGAAVLGCILIPAITYSSRAVGRGACHRWATETGYRTKFTLITWADTGTCLALARNGRWVPNTQIIINTPSK